MLQVVQAKVAPLYLEAQTIQWGRKKFMAFKEQIGAHIHRTRHLSITAKPIHIKMLMYGQLVPPAPYLESLSLSTTENILM